MSKLNLYRAGGLAALLGIVLLFAAYVVPALLAVGVLLFAVTYFALYRLPGVGLPALNLAAVISTLLGAAGLLFTGSTPSVLFNVFMGLALMLPAFLAGLSAYRQTAFPRALPIIGIIAGALGMLNAVANISGGGDWTNLPNAMSKLFSDLTYYPATLLLLVWLVWGAFLLFRKA
ncbi:MAG: hypothetical protein HPY59_03210 [Anaerolineae bacterium]|nr:hypothetical protein [Anaerolineae bacterium]